MKSKADKKAYSRGKRRLRIAAVVGAAFAACVSYSNYQLDLTPNVHIPTPVLPSPNSYDELVAADALIVDNNNEIAAVRSRIGRPALSGSRRATPANRAAIVKKNHAALEKFHHAITLPYHLPPQRSFNNVWKDMAAPLNLAHLVTLEGQVKAERGDWAGAAECEIDVIEMGEILPRGGPVIAMLRGNAVGPIGLVNLYDVVDHLTAPESIAAARRMENIRKKHVPIADVMMEEKWTSQARLLENFRYPFWRRTQKWWPPSQAKINIASIGKQLRMLTISKRAIMVDYTRYQDAVIARCRLPYAAPAAPIAAPTLPIAKDMVGVIDRQIYAIDTRSRTRSALITTVLALHAYQLERGSYPASLAALVPRYLSAVPNDPFALSGPLRYRLAGLGFTLYSIGPDGKDDGGTATDPWMISPTSMGDIPTPTTGVSTPGAGRPTP